MTFTQAKKLLQINIRELDETKLYEYKAKLNTLYFLLNGTHGDKALYDGGFIIPVVDVGAKGFVPKDKFMFTNLLKIMEKTEEYMKKPPRQGDGIVKNIG